MSWPISGGSALRGLPGAADAEAAWAGAATAPPGAECDAALVPVVTGRVDPDVLDRLANALLRPTVGPAAQSGATLSQAAATPSTPTDEARQARALRAEEAIPDWQERLAAARAQN